MESVFYKFWYNRAWISVQDGRICAQNLEIPSKRITRAGDSRSEKFLVIRKFLLIWTKLPVSKKFSDFHVTLDNFLEFMVIFYCWSEVIFFQFYLKLNAVPSKNSQLSHGISGIFLIFCEAIVYLNKMIMDLKNINCGEKFIFLQLIAKIANFGDIMWNNKLFMKKKKNAI